MDERSDGWVVTNKMIWCDGLSPMLVFDQGILGKKGEILNSNK